MNPEPASSSLRRPPGRSPFQSARASMKGTYVRERDEPKLLRSLSMENDIERTTSLVDAYNGATDADERKVLFKWLDSYSRNKERCLRPTAVLQYAQLGKIEVRSDQDIQLLKTLLYDLRSKVEADKFPEKEFGQAIYLMLLFIDSAVTDDVGALVCLAERLLSSFSPTLELYNDVFQKYVGTFLALHLSIVHIQKIAPYRLCYAEKKGLVNTLAKKRRVMKDSLKYYPARFHFELIEQSIKRLDARQSPPFCMQVMQCTLLECCRTLPVLRNSRRSASYLSRRRPAVKDIIEKVKETSNANQIPESQWYELLRGLTAARLQTVRDEAQMEHFMDGVNAVIKSQKKMRGKEGIKKLRFGIIHELSQLSAYGTSGIREEAERKLLGLANDLGPSEKWSEDPDIFEAFVEAVYQAHMRGDRQDATAKTLRRMEQHCPEGCRRVLLTWLGTVSFEDKLRMVPEEEESRHLQEELSAQVGEKLGYISLEEVRHNIDDLKEKYLDNTFAMVSTLGDNRNRRHVDDMHHHIVIYEESIRKSSHDNMAAYRSSYNRASEYYPRVHRMKERVALEDLFKPRQLTPDGGRSEVHKILLYGDHGSGKTCIGKAIAHKWANGEIMQEFKIVFMVSVRELDSSEQSSRNWRTLEEAIARLCYSNRRGPVTKTLLTLVDDALERTNTLLILDGVDEGDEVERSRVLDAKRRNCKVLLLSRSYNIYNALSDIDVEMECLGFDDDEAKNYINKELGADEGQELIEYLYSNVVMWDLARIPLTAYILCILWKEREPGLVDGNRKTSSFSMYTKMANFMWSRFSRDPGMESISRDDIFEHIESIAFEAFRRGQILIGQILVKEYGSTLVISNVLMGCGLLLYKPHSAKYQFPHLRFQKYFAGRYLTRHIHNVQTKEYRNLIDFLAREKYEEKHRETISFMAQGLAQHREVDELRDIFSLIDREPLEIIGVPHFFLKIRIVNAWIAGLSESIVEEAWKNKSISQVVGVATRVLGQLDPNTHLWKIAIDELDQCPNILVGFPKVLYTIMEEKKLEALTSSYHFDDIVKLARHSQKHLYDLTQIVREKLEHENRSVKKQGLEMVKDLLGNNPRLASELLPALDSCCEDPDEDMRQRTMLVIGMIMRMDPKLVETLLPRLERGCVDEKEGVRMITMLALEVSAMMNIHLSENLVSMLCKGCIDEAEGVRAMAMIAIGSLLHRVPILMEILLPMLEKGCEDAHADVRSKAVEAIGRLAYIAPDFSATILPVLEKGCADEHKSVRANAIEGIGRFAAVATDIPIDLSVTLEKGCADEEEDVRKNAKGARDVIGHLATVEPYVPDELLYMIEEGTTEANDSEPGEVLTASTRLASLSEKVTRTKALDDVRDVLDLLIEIPVTVEHTGRNDTVKFVMHSATAQTPEMLNREGVDFLLSAAEDCMEERYPGVLYLMRSA